MDNSTSETDSLKVRARQNVVLCILALLFNSLLLIVVCISARLRKSAKYQLIASLSVADVLLGAVYLPLDTSMAFSGGVWKYRCGLMFFAYGLQEFAMPTITTLTLAALCLEYCVTIFYNVTPVIRRRVVVVGVFIPWILGCLSFAPVYVARIVTSSGSFTSACSDGQWNASALFLLIGVFGYVPLLSLLASLVLMLISFCCRPTVDRLAVRTIIAHSEDVYLTHEITDTVLACFISIAFNVPFLVELVMHVQCDGFSTCASPRRVQHVLEVLRTAESVVFPAVWMLGSEFRHGLFTSCKCCYRCCDMDVELANVG
ncbi:hypothetical protein BaRGS_00038046 [Batillaria attramentaria]|uniref:G-protein coupled receptors family 1 profile domain-containing protein n=1 Tax=Batillaria attramentaria TaxID=370345 RepID=A0ABD0J770_9CAEN